MRYILGIIIGFLICFIYFSTVEVNTEVKQISNTYAENYSIPSGRLMSLTISGMDMRGAKQKALYVFRSVEEIKENE